jgi:hypothetical protein
MPFQFQQWPREQVRLSYIKGIDLPAWELKTKEIAQVREHFFQIIILQ